MELNQQEKEYYELLTDLMEEGEISESGINILNKRKAKYGISDSRAKEIEDFAREEYLESKKPKFETDGEKDYYELLEDMLEDGKIDESERNVLNKRKAKYGISDERAKELEDYLTGLNDDDITSEAYELDNEYDNHKRLDDIELQTLIEEMEKSIENAYEDNQSGNITYKKYKKICNKSLNKVLDRVLEIFKAIKEGNYNDTSDFFELCKILVDKLFEFGRYSEITCMKNSIFAIKDKCKFYNTDYDVSFLFGSSLWHLYNGENSLAKEELEAIIYDYSCNTFPIIYFKLGDAYLGLENYDEAIDAYENSIELDDSNADCWNNYGVALENAGRKEEAKEAYRKALEIDPDYELARNNLQDLNSSSDIVSSIVKSIGKIFK